MISLKKPQDDRLNAVLLKVHNRSHFIWFRNKTAALARWHPVWAMLAHPFTCARIGCQWPCNQGRKVAGTQEKLQILTLCTNRIELFAESIDEKPAVKHQRLHRPCSHDPLRFGLSRLTGNGRQQCCACLGQLLHALLSNASLRIWPVRCRQFARRDLVMAANIPFL